MPAATVMVPRADPRLSRRLVVAAGIAAAVCVFVYLLLVHTALGQRFDNAALVGSQQQQLDPARRQVEAVPHHG
jgi:type VI protein secretion system component VasK